MTDIITEDQAPEAEAPVAESNEVTLYTFANQNPAPELEALLAMFYKGANDNTLGIMQAMNVESGAEEVLLVGVAVGDNGHTECFPLCTLLKAEEVGRYRSPDGKGGWYGVEAAAPSEEADGDRSD